MIKSLRVISLISFLKKFPTLKKGGRMNQPSFSQGLFFLFLLFSPVILWAQEHVIPLEPEGNTPVAAEETPLKSIPTLPPGAARDDVSSPDEEMTPTPVAAGPVTEQDFFAARPWLQ